MAFGDFERRSTFARHWGESLELPPSGEDQLQDEGIEATETNAAHVDVETAAEFWGQKIVAAETAEASKRRPQPGWLGTSPGILSDFRDRLELRQEHYRRKRHQASDSE